VLEDDIIEDEMVKTNSAASSSTVQPPPISERFFDQYRYNPPFSFYERFTKAQLWNTDKSSVRPIEIFPVTGERRKKTVEDNFDWLQPSTRPADRKAVMEAYESHFAFCDGFQKSNILSSSYKFSVPESVELRVLLTYELHLAVMDHPLCNLEDKWNWLVKSVGNLINRIKSAASRRTTRSSIQDVSAGQDIFLFSAYVSADEYVSFSDDVELIDFVSDKSTKKIWHCSNVYKSTMLKKAISTAYKNATADDERFQSIPNWLRALMDHKRPPNDESPTQFLGLVSLFQSKSGNMVTAFHLHSFIIYRFLPKLEMTRVYLTLTETGLIHSSIQERLIQILQLVQSDQEKNSKVAIYPDFEMSPDVCEALMCYGFAEVRHPSGDGRTCFTRNSVLQLAKFTNRTMWGRFGKYLSLPSNGTDETLEPLLNLYCSIVHQLLLQPINSANLIGLRYDPKNLDKHVTSIVGY